ncbi:long-chain fatty acid--CoA ligase [Streptomyces sp. S1]|uniref:AMP-dependent synthetase/ligase n=1 Tax=Streptomyces sp. S1 TaxID=718288 RepID=UPI000EF7F2CB|nr:AMP-binding protein [Streptomyces sp. S1]
MNSSALHDVGTPGPTHQSGTGGIADLLFDDGRRTGRRPVVSVREKGGVLRLDARTLGDEVLALAKGLLASGIQPGDRVGVMCRARYEWSLLDFALWSIGAASVPVPHGAPLAEAEWVLGGTRARACVVEDVEQAMTVAPLLSRLPGFDLLWQLDTSALDVLRRAGSGLADEAVHRCRRSLTPSTIASVAHTAGATGRPRPHLVTHGNLRAAATHLLHAYGAVLAEGGAGVLLNSPFEDLTTRVMQVACLIAGVGFAHQPPCTSAELIEAAQELRPSVLVTEPRTMESLVSAFRQAAELEGRAGAFGVALDVAVRYAEARERKGATTGRGGAGARLNVQHDALDRSTFADLRRSLGGNLGHVLLCGSGMRRRLGLFWAGVGIPVHESYGLTELTGAVTLGPPERLSAGTSGTPLPGRAVHLDEKGHLWVRGGQTATACLTMGGAIRPGDDWIPTGDLGRLDPEGRLTVLGRANDVLVTSTGTEVVPLPLEEEVRSHPLVGHCVVVGHRRPHVAALVTLDRAAVTHWLHMCGRPPLTPRELTRDPALLAEIHRVVVAANKKAPRGAEIRTFRLLPSLFTFEQGLLTRASQPRRARIEQAHPAEVEALYRA